jgi:hypothetical protein
MEQIQDESHRPLIKKSLNGSFLLALITGMKNPKCDSILMGSADLRTDVSQDSEEIEQT